MGNNKIEIWFKLSKYHLLDIMKNHQKQENI